MFIAPVIQVSSPLPPELDHFARALGEILLPAGDMPGYSSASHDRLLDLFRGLPAEVASTWLAACRLMRWRARVLGDIDAAARQRIQRTIDSMSQGNALDRQWLRSVISMIKIGHFSGAEVYERLGLPPALDGRATDHRRHARRRTALRS